VPSAKFLAPRRKAPSSAEILLQNPIAKTKPLKAHGLQAGAHAYKAPQSGIDLDQHHGKKQVMIE
jgi:hypothetical protein